ncbi:hypothetical protein SO3561_00789 [Streptomyces olivochromogenes]|uniref:Uncharacterized protein n=1 Tax=Streptomyces olivochromogenes TaxID=1963 RepID=A0A250V5Q1_STROL|nr:hypothetical protein SO3561_00789 [Streptomyces olivochromogenes]
MPGLWPVTSMTSHGAPAPGLFVLLPKTFTPSGDSSCRRETFTSSAGGRTPSGGRTREGRHTCKGRHTCSKSPASAEAMRRCDSASS